LWHCRPLMKLDFVRGAAMLCIEEILDFIQNENARFRRLAIECTKNCWGST
jgi:hypothetical protein